MAERGFLTDTQADLLAGEYDGSDEGRRATKYRLRQRTERALQDLIQVAESDQIEIDDEVWYRNVPRLIHAVMAPPDDFVPLDRFDGTALDHRKAYPLQYALLDRLVRSVDAYGQAFEPHSTPGGVVTSFPDAIEELREESE